MKSTWYRWYTTLYFLAWLLHIFIRYCYLYLWLAFISCFSLTFYTYVWSLFLVLVWLYVNSLLSDCCWRCDSCCFYLIWYEKNFFFFFQCILLLFYMKINTFFTFIYNLLFSSKFLYQALEYGLVFIVAHSTFYYKKQSFVQGCDT